MVTSRYGTRVHPVTGETHEHSGADFGAPEGAPIYAIADGRVSRIFDDSINGYGIEIVHPSDSYGGHMMRSAYVHMMEPPTHRLGDLVWAPTDRREPWGNVTPPCVPIGYVGSTGRSTGPHLHLTVRVLGVTGWKIVDPLSVIDFSPYGYEG